MRSRLGKLLWVMRLAVGKMREGPGPWLRAVRRGLFDMLPAGWKASLARRRYRLPTRAPHGLTLDGSAFERGGEVSVILPVFNQAELLAESIASVLAQSRADLELIILNDGSTDGVDAVLAQFSDLPRVRVLTQPNRKLPAALTNAFRFARGQFRTWTSADNSMEPEHLAELVRFLDEHPTAAMVYADYRVIGADGAPLSGSDFRPQNRATPESCEVRLPRDAAGLSVLQDNFIGACFLYRGWVGRLIGDYSSRIGIEDYDYWMRLHAEFGIEHLGTDALLYRYRWHDNSLSAKARELRLFELGEQLMEHERQRAFWRAEPWVVHLHESQSWARELDLGSATVVSYPNEGPAVEGKQVLMIAAEAVPPEGPMGLGGDGQGLDGPAMDVVALEWTDPTLVYRFADRLRDPRLLHFAADPDVLEALALFTDQVFEAKRSRERFELAFSFGNERVCRLRSEKIEDQALPRVWTAPGRRRRLLLQVDDFAQGGLECVVLDQARSLGSRGFEMCLLVLGEQGPMIDRARALGLEVLSLPARTADDYAALLAERQIELVLAHHSLFGVATAAREGIPFVQTLHTTYHWFYPDEIEAWRAADADTTAYLHVSANVALFAHQKLGLTPGKSLVLNNGVSPAPMLDEQLKARVELLRSSYDIEAGDFVFLNVASVYPPKAQVPIARALAAARGRNNRLKVILLGREMNEAYARELANLTEELGLGGSLIPAGYHEDPEPFYRLADGFLLPSYWEGCSLAVAEALLRDLPCVLSAVGAAHQQLRDGEGLLVAPPFAAIEQLDFGNLKDALARPRDGFVAELANAMVDCANRGKLAPDPERAARFDIEGVAERLARILSWLQDGGRPAQARPFSWAEWRNGELW